MATIDDNLAKAVVEGFRLAQLDIENQALLLEAPDDVTLTFKDGSTYTGPGFQKISRLAGNSDMGVIGPIAQQIKDAQNDALTAKTEAEASAVAAALSEDKAADSEKAAALSEINAADSATAAKVSADAAELAKTAAEAAEVGSKANLDDTLDYRNNANDSAVAAAASATAAASSAAAALASEGKAKASETAAATSASDAARSASAALAAQQAAETAQTGAQNALRDTQSAKTDAATSATEASQQYTNAKLQADRAAMEASRIAGQNELINLVTATDLAVAGGGSSKRADFYDMPLVKGKPIDQALSSGGMQINTDEMCSSTDNLDDDIWRGKNFMVEKPTTMGTQSSNGAPLAMVYDYAICSDSYASWTPAAVGSQKQQRIQFIYDRDYVWLRGYHAESSTWTNWKRIATQIRNDVTGQDLDTFTATGQYTYTTAQHAPVIDASEASTIYFLEVVATDEGQDVFQIMHSPKTNSRFDRYRVAGKWSQWWNTTATFDVDTAPAGVDVNTLTNPGWWGVPLDTALNLPNNGKTGQAILQVMGVSNGGTFQRLHNVSDGKIHNRYRNANSSAGAAAAWSAWREESMLGSNNTISIAQGGTGATTAPAALTNLGAASLVANTFNGDQTVNGNIILQRGKYLSGDRIQLPGRTNAATITMAEYSAAKAADGTGSQLDARYEIYVTNKADPTKRSNVLTCDVVNSAAPGTGTTSANNATVTVAGKIVAASAQLGAINASSFSGGGVTTGTLTYAAASGSGTTALRAGYRSLTNINTAYITLYPNPQSGTPGIYVRPNRALASGENPYDATFHYDAGKWTSSVTLRAGTAASATFAQIESNGNANFTGTLYVKGISLTGNMTANGTITHTGSMSSTGNHTLGGIHTQAGDRIAIRARAGADQYGTIILNDNGNTYLMATNKGAATGSYSNLRPLYYSNSTGALTMGHTVTVSGTLTANSTLTVKGTSVLQAATVKGVAVTSDRNLKTGVKSITDALAKIDAIDGVTFRYKDDGMVSGGFIAQDVQNVLPEAVANGLKLGADNPDHLYLNYNAVSGLMLNAIKELKAEVLTLKAEGESLKAELAELKAKM